MQRRTATHGKDHAHHSTLREAKDQMSNSSEDETTGGEDTDRGNNVPQAAPVPAKKPTELLVDQPAASKWRNWWIRGALTLLMLVLFGYVIYLGPLALTVVIVLLQLKCFMEIISIGHKDWKNKSLPWWRSINWYFVGVANYYFYGEAFAYFLEETFVNFPSFQSVIRHHRFISLCLYLIGFMGFVLTLKKGHFKFQFKQFGWTHVALLMVVLQSHLIIQNLYQGLIWFILPCTLVVCNDIMAYMFGFFMGRTPLITLSPKKTWEGFIGAFFSTLIFAVLFAYTLSQYPYFICPVESLSGEIPNCTPDAVFQWQVWKLPDYFTWFGIAATEVNVLPVCIHAFVLAVFASLVAPFGGFFASGLKRAFKLKDFDDLIPGHGGITDRFDCQLVMAAIAHAYHASFIRVHTANHLLAMIYTLDLESQIKVYRHLLAHLQNQNVNVAALGKP